MLYAQSLKSRSDHGALGALGALGTLYANPLDKVITLARHSMYRASPKNLLERRRPIKGSLTTSQRWVNEYYI